MKGHGRPWKEGKHLQAGRQLALIDAVARAAVREEEDARLGARQQLRRAELDELRHEAECGQVGAVRGRLAEGGGDALGEGRVEWHQGEGQHAGDGGRALDADERHALGGNRAALELRAQEVVRE